MPAELPPTRWDLYAPPDDHPDDLWALGADLEPETLLKAYSLGLFPMPVGAGIGWFSPASRAVLPLDRFHVSRSLRRARRRFETRIDSAFEAVIGACADPSRQYGWIDTGMVAAYARLHRLGSAHSVEAWDDDGLEGGIYGVAIGGLFAAESMFHRRRDASKVALWSLVELLRDTEDAERRLLDVQWLTPHLESLGAVEIPRAEYRRRLAGALAMPDAFV